MTAYCIYCNRDNIFTNKELKFARNKIEELKGVSICVDCYPRKRNRILNTREIIKKPKEYVRAYYTVPKQNPRIDY